MVDFILNAFVYITVWLLSYFGTVWLMSLLDRNDWGWTAVSCFIVGPIVATILTVLVWWFS